uniref:Nucleoporin Nup43 n=1 Tax=Sphenodon punctatus TaxID=8508 RepID=A0A8D0GWC2_SPHPU
MEDFAAKFVSQKINKTRWLPVPAAALQPPEVFATRSWDNEENKISIWSAGDFAGSGPNGKYQGEPLLLCDSVHSGDVMSFFDQEIVAASSTGSVTIFKHHQNNQTLSINQRWERAHYHVNPDNPSSGSASCTGVICNNPDIFTVGEDGTINVFRADHKEAVRTIIELNLSNPDHLFTGSEDGSLWHWDASTDLSEKPYFFHQGGRSITLLSHGAIDRSSVNQSVISAWPSNDPTKDRMEITNLLPNPTLSVDSLDVLEPCFVCGTDAEAIYVNRQLFA